MGRASGILIIAVGVVACGRLGFENSPAASDAGHDAGRDAGAGMDASGDSGQRDASAEEPDAFEPPPGPVSALRYAWHQELRTSSVWPPTISAIAAAGTEQVALGGSFTTDLDIAGMRLAATREQGFRARFAQESGVPQRVETLGRLGDIVQDLAMDRRGNLYVAQSSVSTGQWSSSRGPDGSPNWIRSDPQVDGVTICARDDGHSFVGGLYLFASDGAGTDLAGDDVHTDSYDGFVMHLDNLGNAVWTESIRGGINEEASSLAATEDQIVAIVRAEAGVTIDLGEGSIPVPAEAHFAMVAYSTDDGHLLWFDFLHGEVRASDLAMDRSGNIYLAGSFGGDTNLAGEVLSTTGRLAFLVAYDNAGTPRWSRTYGDPDWSNECSAVSTDEEGNVFVGGEFTNAADFGAGAVTTDDPSGFVAAYDREGTYHWSLVVGPRSEVTGLSVGERGRLHVAAVVHGVVDLAGIPIGRASTFTAFVASFER